MRNLGAPEQGAGLRARRWDVMVLGGALPGLVAAIRLAMARKRVVVVEEDAAARLAPCVREPFFLPGASSGSPLDECLRSLAVPLIDRRRLEPDPLAYQVVFPDARIDVGEPTHTAEELVAWALAKPDLATELVRALTHAASTEKAAMLTAPIVRGPAVRPVPGAIPRAALAGRGTQRARGLPLAAASPDPRLAAFLDAQVRATTYLGASLPSPEARARLLGAPFEGGALSLAPAATLRGILRRRLEAVQGELRSLGRRFDLVAVGTEPGIAVDTTREVWVAKALVVNAPIGALGAFLAEGGSPPPAFLEAEPPAHRRVAAHYRIKGSVVPEGMGRRLIRIGDRGAPIQGANLITIARYPLGGDAGIEDLVAAAVVRNQASEAAHAEAEIESALRELIPFSENRLARAPVATPKWDDDTLLGDPAPGTGWPAEVPIDLSSSPPIFALRRESTAALGVEGDLLLGLRAGEALVRELGG